MPDTASTSPASEEPGGVATLPTATRPAGPPAPPVPVTRQIVGLVLFCALALGLTWVAALPLWLGPGLTDPVLLTICAGTAMMTPAIAAIVTARVVERRSWRRTASAASDAASLGTASRDTVLASIGLRHRGRVRRLIVGLVVGFTAPVILLFTSQLFAALLGTFDPDFTLRQVAADLGLPADASASEAWLALGGRVLLAMALGGAINLVLAMGEEIGWRGYLMTRLDRLGGRGLAVLAGGAIWGVWHAPLVLLGYNYPDVHPWVGVAAMVASCICVGGFLYLLTVQFGSVWPAGLAHAVNNATSATVMTALLLPGATLDVVGASALGWPGWIVYGSVVLLGFLLLRRRPTPFPLDRLGAPRRTAA